MCVLFQSCPTLCDPMDYNLLRQESSSFHMPADEQMALHPHCSLVSEDSALKIKNVEYKIKVIKKYLTCEKIINIHERKSEEIESEM